jgi:hypothetical protein
MARKRNILENESVSKTLFSIYFEFQMMDKVQNPCDSNC